MDDPLRAVEDIIYKLEMRSSPGIPLEFYRKLTNIYIKEGDDPDRFFYSLFSDDFRVILCVYLHPRHTPEIISEKTGIPVAKVTFILKKYWPLFYIERDGNLSYYSINMKIVENTELMNIMKLLGNYYEEMRIRFRERNYSGSG